MAHFAHITEGLVDQVITAESDYIQSLPNASEWIQTSFNTRGGVHYGQDGNPDQGAAINKNYAGIGYSWDGVGFYAPQPFPSWILDESTYFWNPPVAYPSDGKMYDWNEDILNWNASS
jgi:hypothetical protein